MNVVNEWRNNEPSPTVVVELHQIPYDVVGATTYLRVCDVYNIFSLTGKWQHMELQLHLVAVQLEGKWRGHVCLDCLSTHISRWITVSTDLSDKSNGGLPGYFKVLLFDASWCVQ